MNKLDITEGELSINYYLKGKRIHHREDGPAFIENSNVITSMGIHCSYWIKGKRNRLDGPAIITSTKTCGYFISGSYLTESNFYKRIAK